MARFARKESLDTLDRFGPILVALAFLGVGVSYPPGAPGEPLLGAFSPMFIFPLAFLSGLVGAVVLSRRFVASQDTRPRRLAIRAAIGGTVLAAIDAYVVVVAGALPLPIVVGSITIAAVVAAVDELAGGFFK